MRGDSSRCIPRVWDGSMGHELIMLMMLILHTLVVIGALLTMVVGLLLWWSLIPTTKSLRRRRSLVVSSHELTTYVPFQKRGDHSRRLDGGGTPGNGDVTQVNGQIKNSD